MPTRAIRRSTWYLISRSSAVTGRDLRDAQPTRDEFNESAVRFMLTGDGGRRFAAFTGAHVGDSLAVVLDNKVQEVATIQEQIHDEGRITGSFTEQQAKDLAMVLRSGALPAGIKYLEERTVGPSLGADSIRAGVRAAVIGMMAVLLFMLVYYRGAGINADLALMLNLIILLGFLGFSGATLTLPGIAGRDPDGRHGRGFQRADFRAHTGRAAQRQDAAERGGAGLRARLGHDRGHARDHHCLGVHPVHLRHRPGADLPLR